MALPDNPSPLYLSAFANPEGVLTLEPDVAEGSTGDKARMATNVPRSQQAAGAAAARAAASPAIPADAPRKASGYGLPCAKCRLYYPADLDICPTCHHHERVSAVVKRTPAKLAQPAAEPAHDSAALEKEREEFLRQFKSQLMEAHTEVTNASESVCTLKDHPKGEPASAQVCKDCYERLQERLDLCEAALHLDLQEAAQIIYDAVWADPSDPSKTYQNAASALLSELRKRCGMNSLHGPFHPLAH